MTTLKKKKPNKKKPALTRRGRILVVAAVFLAVLAAVFTIVFAGARASGNSAVSHITDGFRGLLSDKSQFPYDVSKPGVSEIRSMDGSVFVLSKGSAFTMSSSGKRSQSVALDFAAPRVYVNNGRALVCDMSRKTVKLLSKTEKLADYASENEMITAAVAANGSFAIASKSADALSELIVCNSVGSEIYQWKCGKERIVDMSFSANARRLVVGVVGIENAVIYSRILILSFDNEKPLQEVKLDDSMLLRLCMTRSGNTVAVCDNRYELYDKELAHIEGGEFGEGSLSKVAFDDKGNSAICLSDEGGNKTTVIRYNSRGKKLFEATVDGTAGAAEVSGSKTALLTGNKVTVLNRSGDKVSLLELDNVPKDFVYADGHCFTLENNLLKKY